MLPTKVVVYFTSKGSLDFFYDFTEDIGTFLVQKSLMKHLGLLTPSADGRGEYFRD